MKRKRIAAGVVAALTLVVAALLVFSSGDEPKQSEPAFVVSDVHQAFLDTVVATGYTDSATLTPVSEQWWQLVTGMAGSLSLEDQPTPEGALWFGHARSFATLSKDENLFMYNAVYVGFDNEDVAYEYANAFTRSTQTATVSVRNNVAVVHPNWVRMKDEPGGLNTVSSLLGEPVEEGSWSNRFTVTASGFAAADHLHGPVIGGMLRAVGLNTMKSRWYATSDTPDGDWVGTVTEFNPKHANTELLTTTVNNTVEVVCDESLDDFYACDVVDAGWSNLSMLMMVDDGRVTYGSPEEFPVAQRDGDVVWGAVDMNRVEGLLTNTSHGHEPGVRHLEFHFTSDSELTIRPHFR